jgi:mono/diheme cytochrome c family protein
MRGSVRVVPRERYVAFLEHAVAKTALGRQEFNGVCLTCHRLDRTLIGPALAGNSALTDPARLASIVRDGIRTMPAVGSTWTDAQIEALYAYTKGLSASGSQG